MKPNQDIRFLPYRTADRGYGKLYRSPPALFRCRSAPTPDDDP